MQLEQFMENVTTCTTPYTEHMKFDFDQSVGWFDYSLFPNLDLATPYVLAARKLKIKTYDVYPFCPHFSVYDFAIGIVPSQYYFSNEQREITEVHELLHAIGGKENIMYLSHYPTEELANNMATALFFNFPKNHYFYSLIGSWGKSSLLNYSQMYENAQHRAQKLREML